MDPFFLACVVINPIKKSFTNTLLFSGLKVRVGEYDASAFKSPERYQHEEYRVNRVIFHPQFDRKRLSNDIAILRLDQRVNLNHRYVNAACMPACDQQFSFTFR